MILEALHTTLNPVLTAYPLVGEITAEPPFCIYAAEPRPIRTKQGISDYEHTVNIKIVSRKTSQVNTYTESIRTAIEGISGTVNSTVFKHILYMDETGVYYNSADDIYINDLEFKIFTQNR